MWFCWNSQQNVRTDRRPEGNSSPKTSRRYMKRYIEFRFNHGSYKMIVMSILHIKNKIWVQFKSIYLVCIWLNLSSNKNRSAQKPCTLTLMLFIFVAYIHKIWRMKKPGLHFNRSQSLLDAELFTCVQWCYSQSGFINDW